jgi:acyl carrier protein
MKTSEVEKLRSAIFALLATKGHRNPVTDTDSLFVSGRLDSHAATEVIMILESDFGIDLSNADFDIMALDTIASMAEFIDSQHA